MFKTTLNYLKRTYNQIAGHFRQLYVFKKYPAVKELLKYSVAGNFSNLIDFGVYIYLTRTFSFWRHHYLTVNLISMLLASITRFFLQKYWTFKDTRSGIKIQYIRFIIVLFLGLIASQLVLYISVEHIYINDLLGKILAFAVATLIVYTLSKKWVFNNGH